MRDARVARHCDGVPWSCNDPVEFSIDFRPWTQKLRCMLRASHFALVLIFSYESRADRPNIIFIFSDDHAEHAVSCYGSKVNQTPHIDRIAKGGARFANAFVTNSICTPSRATLLTGQYSHIN